MGTKFGQGFDQIRIYERSEIFVCKSHEFLDPLKPLQSEKGNRNHFLERSQNRRHRKCPIQSPQPLKKALPIQTLAQSTCHRWRNQALQK